MQAQRFENQYVLRLEPGEEVTATLCDFVRGEGIGGGYFVAFGAFSRVLLQYFDMVSLEYEDNPVERQVEVVSLTGNIAWKGNDPKLHIHAALGDRDGGTCSGHLTEGVVRPTLEVFLTRLDGELRREKDPDTGLDLLALAPEKREEPVGPETGTPSPDAVPYTP
jgi:uncharacterized protein